MKKYLLVLFLFFSISTIYQTTEAGTFFTTILERITLHRDSSENYFNFPIIFRKTVVVTHTEEIPIIQPGAPNSDYNENTKKAEETYLNRLIEKLNLFQKNSESNFSSSDCEIPKGGIAFSINSKDGNGEQCGAKTVFSGFNQYFKKGVFGGGYVNPMLEKDMKNKNASVQNCKKQSVAAEYGEKCFANYDLNSEGFTYIQTQLIHWQHEGEINNQKCVPIYLDNCDSIGKENYKKILDSIENLNNSGKVKLKVLLSNPQNDCGLFSHSAVMGALIEEINEKDLQKVINMRQNPQQLLLFTRGGKGTNENLQKIENLNIPNSFYSYDSGKEYEIINRCTYHQ